VVIFTVKIYVFTINYNDSEGLDLQGWAKEMLGSATQWMLLVCGLVLVVGILYLIPAVGKYLEKLAKWLGSFQAIIGIVAVVVAIWQGLGNFHGLVLLLVGIMLAISILSAIPALGKYLKKMVKALGGVQVIIGIIALALAFID
jgi:hypothetical protein